MTAWTRVQGSQPEQPKEFDTESSTAVVYQRKNIVKVIVNNEDGSSTELWEYDERKLTHEEYAAIRATEIDQVKADVDFIAAMAGIDL